ncbi:MAG: DegT/DnrJ/EryC1/StrS family aminotransferase [Deltaproteobacteria bacterium]|nr:DegT/DnrJ/EryC1/StrS family aminotransferase [Deltaproteobacteria bacterium]
MKVPLLDLKKQYENIHDEIALAVKEVFDSQYFILGPKVAELEKGIAEYCQCQFAVGVSSGTDALLISLMTAGIGSGDLVVTTPYTFFATAGVITRLGARPVFVDIDPDTYNMDPRKLDETISAIGEIGKSKVRAVMPIHLYGQCADMESILNVAGTYGLTVIEDAAQAIGAEYEFGDGTVRRAGSMGHFGCFSFFPSKNLGAFGDGGMVTTDEEGLYEAMKVMRVHGSKPKYYHSMVGGNFRLDALQAAILMVKLKYLDEWTKARQKNADLYRRFFQEEGIEGISLPKAVGKRHIYNQFVIKVREHRDRLKAFLQQKGIGCEIYYPLPLHMQTCFGYLGYKPEEFPISVAAADTTLALPIYPELTTGQISYVVEMIGEFF